MGKFRDFVARKLPATRVRRGSDSGRLRWHSGSRPGYVGIHRFNGLGAKPMLDFF